MSDRIEPPLAGEVYVTADGDWWRINRITETRRIIYAGFNTTEYGMEYDRWSAWVLTHQARKVDLDAVIAAGDPQPQPEISRLNIAAILLAPRIATVESASADQVNAALRSADLLIKRERETRG